MRESFSEYVPMCANMTYLISIIFHLLEDAPDLRYDNYLLTTYSC